MKGAKLVVCAVCAIVAIGAAIAAIVIFKDQITYFIADIKDKIDEKRYRRNGEYADYAD